ncbi:SDR family oxidoreductase [Labedaea rhizosphaerae]|uniref:NAD(P)-dependent dehydrogenase (Short-subunit alcohol dehydrogenase family) n=1 Tax=Labedaea rhizosphaerae TaxID=598644 RepID=A0A4R6SMW1_LABRH|nr:SDR family oxidoreductase [Labedaea rhizosphaerae]TDQ05241.1 NAD(P)-dependent dehydrogenase (short-subunit alcohol dehydrogenase family) [Labedaea rhizosphaerae]
MTLAGKVAVVTGATRGCGRGIAVELGALGATVYVTGRTTREQRSPMNRPETIEETAELVDAVGGKGIPVRCDFTKVSDVDALVDRIDSGVDILVDDVWGGDPFHVFGVPYWEQDLDAVLSLVRNGVETHLIALHRLMPLVVRNKGMVVEITDGDDETYHGAGLAYYLVKSSMRALGRALAGELEGTDCTALTVTPGFLRSEFMLDHFGVTEATWRDGVAKEPHFVMSETPRYIGRGIAALADDPEKARFNGKVMASWTLMREYGFTDLDGTRPDWGRWYDEVVATGKEPDTVDAAAYR